MVFLITSSESLLFDDVIRNIYNKHTIINKGYSACFKSDCNFHLQLFSDYHLFDNHYLKIFPKMVLLQFHGFQSVWLLILSN